MKRTTPPFRADHVGSYLRSAAITEARAKRDKGQISAADLKKVEDQEIPKVIKKQEEVGLQCATDGEYRRMFWHFDFYDGLDNVEIYELDHGIQFQGVQTKPKSIRVTGKIDFTNHPMLEHFKFLKANTKVMPKMCIPSPTVLHFRLEPGAVDKKAYANNDAIFSDLSAAYRKAVKAFYDAGCRYLQFDDTAWAYLCSDVEMKKAKERGMNTATIADDYTRVINDSIKDKPADMVITTHVCRGNFRSTWISSGGYEPVAEKMLGRVQLRRLLPRVRQRARRRLRAAAFLAEGQEDRGGRRHHVEERHLGEQGHRQAPDRRGVEVRPARATGLEPAVRLRQHGRRQRADRGAAVGEDARSGRGRRRDLGEVAVTAQPRPPARRHRRARPGDPFSSPSLCLKDGPGSSPG